MRFTSAAPVAGLCLLLTGTSAHAITIDLDYSLDTNNFFDTQAKRDALRAAADIFEVLTDSLDAIVPGTVYNEGTQYEFTDTWDAIISHPGTGSQHTITDLTIAQDTLLVYAGGRNIPGTRLGIGGPGGYDVFGISEFVGAVSSRNQHGADLPTPTDFGTWGGAVAFDSSANWHFDPQTDPAFNEISFFTVAIHELGHLMGIGTADSFLAQISGGYFTGPESVSVYGGNVPLAPELDHWADGTMSTVPGGGAQEAILTPYTGSGEQLEFTLLDYAALTDIGWEVPEIDPGVLEGDLNGDGFVGVDDLNIVLVYWNQNVVPGDWSLGDATGEGYVGVDDLNIVLVNWNSGTPPADTATIPEPACIALLGLGGIGLTGRRFGR